MGLVRHGAMAADQSFAFSLILKEATEQIYILGKDDKNSVLPSAAQNANVHTYVPKWHAGLFFHCALLAFKVVSEMSPASSSSDAASPASSLASTPSSAMSVQHYRSQFIKEGLKLKVRQKLGDKAAASVTASVAATRTSSSSRLSSGESIEPVHSPVAAAMVDVSKVKEELTEEDEMRRMRRRERNKVAATKCRNKKKMRTQMLIKVSHLVASHFPCR